MADYFRKSGGLNGSTNSVDSSDGFNNGQNYKYCRHCGAKILNDSAFCSACGMSVMDFGNKGSATSDPDKLIKVRNPVKKISNIYLYAIICAAFVLITISGFLIFKVWKAKEIKKCFERGYASYVELLDANHVNIGYLGQDYEFLSNVDKDFDKVYKLIGKDVEKYKKEYQVITAYRSLTKEFYFMQNTRLDNLDADEWESKLEEYNSMSYSDDEIFDEQLDVLKHECEAAIMYYDFDYYGACEEIEQYKDIIPNAYYTILFNDLCVEKLIDYDNHYSEGLIERIENGSLKVISFYATQNDLSGELKAYDEYPLVACCFNGSDEQDFYYSYNQLEGKYNVYTIGSDMALSIAASYTYEPTSEYEPSSEYIVDAVSAAEHILDGSIRLIKDSPY